MRPLFTTKFIPLLDGLLSTKYNAPNSEFNRMARREIVNLATQFYKQTAQTLSQYCDLHGYSNLYLLIQNIPEMALLLPSIKIAPPGNANRIPEKKGRLRTFYRDPQQQLPGMIRARSTFK